MPLIITNFGKNTKDRIWVDCFNWEAIKEDEEIEPVRKLVVGWNKPKTITDLYSQLIVKIRNNIAFSGQYFGFRI